MSEFVPTTEEVRRSFVYAESSEFVATVPGKGNDAWARVPASGDVKATRVRDGKIHTEATAEFDRWLAALIREAKAEALNEAADELDSYDLSLGSDKMPPEGDWHVDIGYYGEANWLRARAAEYREGSET